MNHIYHSIVSESTQIAVAAAATIVLTCMTLGEFSRSVHATASGPPQLLTATADTFSVGNVLPSTKCPLLVNLTNHTSEPIRIRTIRPGCTCSDFKLETETVPGGGSVPLEIILSAPDTLGNLGAGIGVEYSSGLEIGPDTPVHEFYFSVDGTVAGVISGSQ